MDLKKMNELMAGITKRYQTLNPENGELQSWTDLIFYLEDGYITNDEYEFLKAYSRQLYNVLTNH